VTVNSSNWLLQQRGWYKGDLYCDSSASESETDEDTLQTVNNDGTSSYKRSTPRLKQQLSGMAGQLQESLLM